MKIMKKLAKPLAIASLVSMINACEGCDTQPLPDAGVTVSADAGVEYDAGNTNCEEEDVRRGVELDVIDAVSGDKICNADVSYESANGSAGDIGIMGFNCSSPDRNENSYGVNGITEPGTYTVIATAPEYLSNQRTVVVAEDDCGHLVRVNTFISLQPENVPVADAGVNADSGVEYDAGQDSGIVDSEDAGVTYDAGVNADSGVTEDAGSDAGLVAVCQDLSGVPACLGENAYIAIGEQAAAIDQYVASNFADAYENVTRTSADQVSLADKVIVYGTACNNSLVAELQGNPANCTDGLVPNESTIELIDDNTVAIVGYTGLERKAALDVLQNRTDELAGTKFKITGTDYATADIEEQ